MKTTRTPLAFSFTDPKPHVLIVEGRFYDSLNDSLIEGARRVFDRAGVTYEVCTVPGALEIPTAIRLAMKTDKFDGFVALGCVLKGSTHHDQIVGTESAHSLQVLGFKRGAAIGNGILTCNTHEQAVERADPDQLDRGGAAAEACLRLIEIKRQWADSARSQKKQGCGHQATSFDRQGSKKGCGCGCGCGCGTGCGCDCCCSTQQSRSHHHDYYHGLHHHHGHHHHRHGHHEH